MIFSLAVDELAVALDHLVNAIDELPTFELMETAQPKLLKPILSEIVRAFRHFWENVFYFLPFACIEKDGVLNAHGCDAAADVH